MIDPSHRAYSVSKLILKVSFLGRLFVLQSQRNKAIGQNDLFLHISPFFIREKLMSPAGFVKNREAEAPIRLIVFKYLIAHTR